MSSPGVWGAPSVSGVATLFAVEPPLLRIKVAQLQRIFDISYPIKSCLCRVPESRLLQSYVPIPANALEMDFTYLYFFHFLCRPSYLLFYIFELNILSLKFSRESIPVTPPRRPRATAPRHRAAPLQLLSPSPPAVATPVDQRLRPCGMCSGLGNSPPPPLLLLLRTQ